MIHLTSEDSVCQLMSNSPDLLTERSGPLTHHGRSSLTNDSWPRAEGLGLHDAGGGDVQRSHVEAQQDAEEQQHQHHLED